MAATTEFRVAYDLTRDDLKAVYAWIYRISRRDAILFYAGIPVLFSMSNVIPVLLARQWWSLPVALAIVGAAASLGLLFGRLLMFEVRRRQIARWGEDLNGMRIELYPAHVLFVDTRVAEEVAWRYVDVTPLKDYVRFEAGGPRARVVPRRAFPSDSEFERFASEAALRAAAAA